MQSCYTARMVFSTQCFLVLLNVIKCRLVTAAATVSCSCCWNQHHISTLMTCSQKHWPSKILADSEILTNFTNRTWIAAYLGLCVLSLFTHPHYHQAKVSTKTCPRVSQFAFTGRYQAYSFEGGGFSSVFRIFDFLFLGWREIISGWLSWHHVKLKKMPKKCRKYHYQIIPEKDIVTWDIIWIHHK